jgi:hypothetical protein
MAVKITKPARGQDMAKTMAGVRKYVLKGLQSFSPSTACDAPAPASHPRIDRCPTECKKLSASEAPDPGRHHLGTPGDIMSECPGDFVGIRI